MTLAGKHVFPGGCFLVLAKQLQDTGRQRDGAPGPVTFGTSRDPYGPGLSRRVMALDPTDGPGYMEHPVL